MVEYNNVFALVHRGGVIIYSTSYTTGNKCTIEKIKTFEYKNCQFATWSSKGTYLGIVHEEQVCIINDTIDKTICSLPIENCQKFYFSPLETYAVIIYRNLKTVNDLQIVTYNIQKSQLSESTKLFIFLPIENNLPVVWVDSEKFYWIPGDKGIEVCEGPIDEKKSVVASLNVSRVQTYAISQQKIAVFVPAQKSSAQLTIYEFDEFSNKIELVNALSSEIGDTAKLLWRPFSQKSHGTNLLAVLATDVDKTGKSYYGSSCLAHIEGKLNGKSSIIISFENGPIHDVTWSPQGKEFIVIHGSTNMYIYDGETGKPIYFLGNSKRNIVRYSPFERFFSISGFRGLLGDTDIWDRSAGKIIGAFNAAYTIDSEWSPDGRMILCSVTTPRMRVDNVAKIFLYNGELIEAIEINELYSSIWKNPAVILNDRPASPERLSKNPIAKHMRLYRPPQLSDEEYAKRVQAKVSQYQSTMIEVKKSVPLQKTPPEVPGAEFLPQSKSQKRNALRKKKKREAKLATQ